MLWQQERLVYIDDSDFREKAIMDVFKELDRDHTHYRTLSLVDRVIREILSKPNLKIDLFKTFNEKDFMDVCKRFRRILL